MKKYFFLCLGLLFLWSCASRKVHPKEPEVVSRTHFVREELSTLYFPIEVSINQVERTVNELFESEIYRDESYTNNDNDNLKVIVKKLSKIKLHTEGNTIKMVVPLSVWAKARQTLFGMEASQDVDFDVNLYITTQVDIDENWNLKTNTKEFKYDFVTEPVLNVAGIKFPINSVITNVLNTKLEAFLPTIDQQITESVDLRQQVDSVWKSTHYPINIDEEYNTWVKLKPKRFIFSPIKGEDRVITTGIGIESFIEVVTGEVEMEKIHNKPLPKLAKVEIPSDTFHLALSSELAYNQLSDILKKELIGFTYKSKKREIKITNVSSYGNGDDMVFRIDFEGDIEGEVFASGRPAYDSLTKELYIENFDFDINTKKTLIRVGKWLLKGTFKKQVEKRMRFSLEEEFDNMKQMIEESLIENTLGEGLHLDCEILSIYPKDISLTDFSVKTLLIIDGKAKVKFGR
ncbi:MAG: DUF4403 family protein [Cytophagales bacterium]|nr:DUF4403 family protein [Cytophagales bacterium]